jgi:hypothetical protein
VPEEKSTSTLHLMEHRSERRILVNVAVEVTEFNSEGHPFTERTFIEDVSDMGCRFSTRGSVHQGDTVAVKILGPNGASLPDEKPRYYEIMWVAPQKQRSTVGARLIQGEKLANLKLPPQNGGTKPGAK